MCCRPTRCRSARAWRGQGTSDLSVAYPHAQRTAGREPVGRERRDDLGVVVADDPRVGCPLRCGARDVTDRTERVGETGDLGAADARAVEDAAAVVALVR